MMHHSVPRQIHILRKAAPQMWLLLRRRVAVADRVWIGAPVGVFAMPVLPTVAPFAFAATDIVLDKDEVALFESFASREFPAGLGDGADILVAHDHRRARRRVLVKLDVSAADATDLHLQKGRILGNIRHGIFPYLGGTRRGPHRRHYFFGH